MAGAALSRRRAGVEEPAISAETSGWKCAPIASGARGWRREHAASDSAHWPTRVAWCSAPPPAHADSASNVIPIRMPLERALRGVIRMPLERRLRGLLTGAAILAGACDRKHPE